MSNITIRKLKWISIIAPALFIGGFEIVLHRFFPPINDWWFDVLVVGAASYTFSHFVFRQVSFLQRDIVRRSLEMSALNNIVQAAGRSLDIGDVLQAITDKVLEVFPGAGAGVFLTQNDKLVLSHQKNLPSSWISPVFDLNETSLKGCELVCARTAKEGKVGSGACDSGMRYVFAPIVSAEGVLGVFCVSRDKAFEDWEVDFLSLVSREVGSAVEHARLHSRVEELVVLEERDRIAKEIHDGLAQVLGYVSLRSATVQQLLAADKLAEAKAQLGEMEKVAQEAYTDAREAILGLRTSVGLPGGLLRALNEYIDRIKRGSGIQIDLEIEDSQKFKFAPAAEVQLIRIVQEALTNVRKHAEATKASVRFRLADGVALVSVEDNGCGFDVKTSNKKEGHFGLESMRERATKVGGAFRVESTLGKGTKVEVALPLRVEEEKVEVSPSIISR